MAVEKVALVTFYEASDISRFKDKGVPSILGKDHAAQENSILGQDHAAPSILRKGHSAQENSMYQSLADLKRFMHHVEFESHQDLDQFRKKASSGNGLLENLVKNQVSTVYVAMPMSKHENATTLGLGYNLKLEHKDDFIKECQAVLGVIGTIPGELETDILVDTSNKLRVFVYSAWSSVKTFRDFVTSDVFKGVTQKTRHMITDRPSHHLYRRVE